MGIEGGPMCATRALVSGYPLPSIHRYLVIWRYGYITIEVMGAGRSCRKGSAGSWGRRCYRLRRTRRGTGLAAVSYSRSAHITRS